MKRKQILALALAIAVASGAAATVSMNVLAAADFTQAKTPSQVNYGTLTDSQLAIVKAHFDPKFYAEKYDDVVKALGTDKDILLKHFVMCGIFEGRKGWNDFDPSAYASAYSNLKDKFGNDIPKYYSHYYNKGITESRKYTTIDACEAAGIKVVSFFDEEDLLSVDVFAASNLMGTADYSTVSSALDTAAKSGAASVTTNGDTYVIVPTKTAEKTLESNETVTIEDSETPKSGDVAVDEKVDAQPEETAEEQQAEEVAPVVEEPHFEELGKVEVSNGGQVKECAILVLRNGEGYEPKLIRNMTDDMESVNHYDIVAIVPIVIFSVEEANNIIRNENYSEIPEFEAESGNVVGTEGVTFNETNTGLVYHMPIDEESSYDKMMTNYVDGAYRDNAPVAVDENGYDGTDYQVSADVRADENGDAKVTAIVKSEDGFEYKATYVFEGTAQKADAVEEEASEETASTEAEDTADVAEDTVEATEE